MVNNMAEYNKTNKECTKSSTHSILKGPAIKVVKLIIFKSMKESQTTKDVSTFEFGKKTSSK